MNLVKETYKPHGRPQNSASIIWYVLHLRYTPLKANRLLLENFECYLCHLLNKVQQDVVDALKVLKSSS